MHLVQILMPIVGPPGDFKAVLTEIESALTEMFGGVTSYARAPARGLWQDRSAAHERDDIIVVEVMVAALDRPWWQAFRGVLERLLDQEQLVIRAIPLDAIDLPVRAPAA